MMGGFNPAGPDGLIDGKAPGARPCLHAHQREALRTLIKVSRRLPLTARYAGARAFLPTSCAIITACRFPCRP